MVMAGSGVRPFSVYRALCECTGCVPVKLALPLRAWRMGLGWRESPQSQF